MRKKELYLMTDKRDLERVGGDLALLMWYSVLKDYSRRMNRDRDGFTRVSSKVFETDLGADRKKVWRYNRKLEDKGLIAVDRISRGGRTWIGFKLL